MVSAPANDMKAQTDFITTLFSAAARPGRPTGSHMTCAKTCNRTCSPGLRVGGSILDDQITCCLHYDAPSGNEGARSSDQDVEDATQMLVGYL